MLFILHAICTPLTNCKDGKILQVKFLEGEKYNPITLKHSSVPTNLK